MTLAGVAYAPRLPLVGSLLHLMQARSDFLSETAERLGDSFALHLGRDQVLVVGNPADAARVLEERPDVYVDRGGSSGFRRSSIPFLGGGLSTWNGMDAEWRRRRTGMARIFHAGSSIDFPTGPGTARPDQLRAFIERLIVGDLVHVVLGIRAPSSEVTAVTEGLHQLAGTFWRGKVAGPHPILAGRSQREVHRLEAIALSWATEALESADSPLAHHVGSLTPTQVRDEVLSQLLSAGTLAVPVLWGLDRLAHEPAVQERFRASLTPGSADAAYATWTMREIFRLCPSTYWMQRRAAADDELSGVPVPQGTRVVIHVPRVHRHPDFWVEPNVFMPERFGDDGWKRAWMPFGRGPRACMARSYSFDAATRILFGILAGYQIEATGKAADLVAGFSLVMRHPPRIAFIPLETGQASATF